MSPHPSPLARLLLRLVPARYRADVADDLLREHRGRSLTLYRAIVKSARDARRVQRQHEPREPLLSGLRGDVAQAMRHARRRPGLTISAALTVALAVGVNTAVFTVTRSVLLRPLPFPDEARVGFVWSRSTANDALEPMSPARALDLSRTPIFESAALIGNMAMTVTGLGEAERWSGASVSADFFDVLRTPPLVGRTFTGADRGRDMVVLSHAWWRSRFGGDPSVIGRSITMGGRARVIVGVMGPDMYWPVTTPKPTAAFAPTFWAMAPAHGVPERPGGFNGDPTQERFGGYVRLVARVRADVPSSAVAPALIQRARDLAAQHPRTDSESAVFVTARAQLLGGAERPLWLLTLATGLVVLGAAANVAGLFLVNLAAREREFAVRSALGAGRRRLARQCIAESFAIAGVGGVVGAGLAVLTVPALASWLPSSLARRDVIDVDAGVFVVAAVITTLVALLAATGPVFQLVRRPRLEAMRTAGTVGARLWGRGFLVGAEAAVAVVVVTLTVLMGSSLMRLRAVDVGFDTANLLTFHVALTGERANDVPSRVAFFHRLLDEVRSVPGVRAAAGAVTLPIGGDDFGSRAFPEGRPLPPVGEERRVGYQIVTPEWFSTLGVPIVDGRDLGTGDTPEGAPVVLVNESLARWAWPGESPVGRRFRTGRASTRWLTVVGVVKDIHHLGPGAPPRLEYYRPLAQESLSFLAVAVRAERDAASLAAPIRSAVAALDGSLPLADIALMSDHLRADYEDAETMSALTTVFGGLALVLAAIGVYSAVAFSVAARTAEFGLRSALGAQAHAVRALVIRQALRPVIAGALVGLAIAWLLGESVRAQLFDVSPHSPTAYAGALLAIIAAGVGAAYIPARRAARIDPLKALRSTT